jgi:hypothetical protein
MAITHKEIVGSKEGSDATDRSSSTELAYILRGSDNIDDMRAYLLANNLRPATVDGLIYRSISREQIDRQLWRWAAKYVEADRADARDKLDVGDTLFSFDTTGGTTIAFGSRHTSRFAKVGETAIDHKSAVNVKPDGSVEGAEIAIPALKFSIKVRKPKASITTAYVKTLAKLTGTVNLLEFRDFKPGELLFQGANGQEGSKTDPEVEFHFAASQNADGVSGSKLTIGDVANIVKKGHEYLWIWFEAVVDATAKGLARRPKYVYVERLYEEVSWADLGVS